MASVSVRLDDLMGEVAMFGEWLDKRLDALGWTNAHLAQQIGVSTGAVWSWRQDRYPPRIDHLPGIAAALGTSEFEVYCAVRGYDYEQVSDGRLMSLLDLHPNDSLRVIKLAAKLMPVLLQYAEEMREEESGTDNGGGTAATGRTNPGGAPAPTGTDHGRHGRSRGTWAVAADGERRHRPGGASKRGAQDVG
jgi:transcriptional regulator with XRE-family HTH domain